MKLLQTLKLTNTQKEVLSKIKAAATPVLALERLTGANMQSALETLSSLGILTYDEENVDITEKGEDLMKDYNLIDEMGELTDEGNSFASLNNDNDQPPIGNMGDDMGAFESFSLLKQII